ncbi:MAG: phosphoglucosamine mutase, partial [Eubacteriales bacterium]|nr:phosphoglucosamine mutase [Eubacteriales bacterium]
SKAEVSKLFEDCPMYPQCLKNVRVGDKDAAMNDPEILAAVDRAAGALGDSGRILYRASGTEPLVRVMVEAGTTDECEKYVNDVIAAIYKSGYAVG